MITTNTIRHDPIDIQEVRARYANAARYRTRTRPRAKSQTAAWRTAADVPRLCDEIERLRADLAVIRRNHADLIAAARATLGAAADGEPQPLAYLRDELTWQGHLAAGGGATW